MILNAITWDFSPEIFKIGSLEVRYYGLLWAASFFIGFTLMRKIFLKEGKKEALLDPLLYAVLIGAILGARLGHVFFYDWDYYQNNLGDILKVWQGGLASHGGAIGVILALWWYAKKKLEGDFLWIVDRVVIMVALSALFIRLGNFFNSEIVGTPTNLPWGVEFVRLPEYAGMLLHPAQLYEAFFYLLIFLFLFYAYYKTKLFSYPGKPFGFFLVGVFTVRFFVEFVKESQGGIQSYVNDVLTSGQLLSIPFIILGIYFLFFRKATISV